MGELGKMFFDILSNACKCLHSSMETIGKIFLISVSVGNNNYIVPLQYIFFVICTEIELQ